jgi:hypothetical protein
VLFVFWLMMVVIVRVIVFVGAMSRMMVMMALFRLDRRRSASKAGSLAQKCFCVGVIRHTYFVGFGLDRPVGEDGNFQCVHKVFSVLKVAGGLTFRDDVFKGGGLLDLPVVLFGSGFHNFGGVGALDRVQVGGLSAIGKLPCG